jgi:membrane-bound ClpP family serine protease
MNMKKTGISVALVIICQIFFAGICIGDTFTNRQTKEVVHGYAVGVGEGGQIKVQTQEKGEIVLNSNDWQTVRARSGRNNEVIVLGVDEPIMYQLETETFEKALASDANEGPLLILVEIDTPGGRIDYAKQMCAAITKTTNCDVIAYIKGGQYGGALSAGSAIALACNKIYMADNTVIGAATIVSSAKAQGFGKDKTYREVIDEKSSSAWRAFLASLAQHNNRSGLLARAMVDSSIDVIEVNQAGSRDFIESVNKKPGQQVLRYWNKSGSLLTLTAQEAVDCSIADGLANSRQELLQQLGIADANVVIEKRMANARRELELVGKRLAEIRKSLDLKIKQAQNPQPTPKALSILRGARSDFETLITLTKKYPDLPFDVAALESELNSINAEIEKISRESRSRKQQ